MWEALGLAGIELIKNLASAPQLLTILVLEGIRIVYRRKYAAPAGPRADLKPLELFLEVWRSSLNAAPSIGLTVSIFFVRF